MREQQWKKKRTIAIFVYGTLKIGFKNYNIIKDGIYHSDGETVDNFSIINIYDIPFMLPDNQGGKVKGEIHYIDEKTLESLDHFECIEAGTYIKETIKVKAVVDNTITECIAYIGGAEANKKLNKHKKHIEYLEPNYEY